MDYGALVRPLCDPESSTSDDVEKIVRYPLVPAGRELCLTPNRARGYHDLPELSPKQGTMQDDYLEDTLVGISLNRDAHGMRSRAGFLDCNRYLFQCVTMVLQ